MWRLHENVFRDCQEEAGYYLLEGAACSTILHTPDSGNSDIMVSERNMH